MLALGLLASPATADMPHHPHALLLHVEATETSFTYARCIDLANGRALPNHVHHASVHMGPAGAALQGAGHAVAPYSCAQIAEILG
jgi:hypothetical protein